MIIFEKLALAAFLALCVVIVLAISMSIHPNENNPRLIINVILLVTCLLPLITLFASRWRYLLNCVSSGVLGAIAVYQLVVTLSPWSTPSYQPSVDELIFYLVILIVCASAFATQLRRARSSVQT